MKIKAGTGQAQQLAGIINEHHTALLDDWMAGLVASLVRRDKIAENELRQQAAQLLPLLAGALDSGDAFDIEGGAWDDTRQLLAEISQSRVRQGYSPIDTASFMFALKEPLFAYLRQQITAQPEQLGDAIVSTSKLFDELGLLTIAIYQKAREQVILRQQQELLELSTPVVQLWRNVLALPLIGTLDSARTQVVMESLLQKIVDTGALIAIIDITGVPTVDTLVAQHLLKTIAAARLMGADCIISGIRPQIAQTIVHLGVNLEDVMTKATLADAFVVALKRTGSSITCQQQQH
ncbi:anti-sigma factor antagonist [Janthinobacterium lividum]|uniref:Anti-sigma factor antagonist n=1 Tax=Janthinobacterium lividum TaxID=29581 RepID=A0A1S1U6F1_9BURK|nr:STAS domain-containing protein [Janthinobacterium lividum]OHV95659.1 anti-sigma factor antagonist [Janthinobacterium lividum]